MACAKIELCIFDKPTPQIVVQSARFEEIYPLNSITGNNCNMVEFSIPASTTEYLDLNDTLLYLKVKVTDDKGANLVADANLIPSNYFLYTIFKDAILYLNNTKIEGGNESYAQKALFDTMLNYTADTKDVNLETIGYDETDDGRKAWIAGSKKCELCGPLRLDFFDQPKYLIPRVSVRLKLIKHDVSFPFKGIAHRMEFLDAKLFVRRVKVSESVYIGHMLGMEKHNAIYPIRQTRVESHTIAIGSTTFSKDNIFTGVLPKFVVIAFQKNIAFNGDLTTDSSKFKDFGITSLILSQGNEFREQYKTDFTGDNGLTLAYITSLIKNMGHLDKSTNSGITFKEWRDKYTLFTFQLAPDFDSNSTQLMKEGNLHIDIKFAKGLTSAVSMIIYGIFDSEVQIAKNGTVFA